MKNLTDSQALAILSLSEKALSIGSISISSGVNGLWVSVFSKENADWNDCDQALYEIFPTAKYDGGSRVVKDDEDGSSTEIFHLTDPSGARITLYMKKAPAPTGATLEISQSDYTTESEVVANG